MPGVLEALSGAVAARLAAQETTNGNVASTFNAGKNSVQGKQKRKGGKEKMWECLREQRMHVK